MAQVADAGTFLDRLVLISNSVPKSGSTYLYAMQQNFLLSLVGRKTGDFRALAEAGVKVEGGFIPKPHSKEFLTFISQENLQGGPFVVKTHTLLNAELREVILNSPNVYASVAIRDPLEVYFSARDNFRKSGEFPEFAEVGKGCETVNSYFRKIYESSINTSRQKTVPLVRYEDIVRDPIGALIASLHPDIRLHVMRRIAEGHLNLKAAQGAAVNRLNIGGVDRLTKDRSSPEFGDVMASLAETRRSFGYGTD